MTLYDDKVIEDAIRGLDSNIRLHLAHVYRNGLQTIVCCLETEQYDEAKRQALRLGAALKEMGI